MRPIAFYSGLAGLVILAGLPTGGIADPPWENDISIGITITGSTVTIGSGTTIVGGKRAVNPQPVAGQPPAIMPGGPQPIAGQQPGEGVNKGKGKGKGGDHAGKGKGGGMPVGQAAKVGFQVGKVDGQKGPVAGGFQDGRFVGQNGPMLAANRPVLERHAAARLGGIGLKGK